MSSSCSLITAEELLDEEPSSPTSFVTDKDLAHEIQNTVRLYHHRPPRPQGPRSPSRPTADKYDLYRSLARRPAREHIMRLPRENAEAVLDMWQEWLDWASSHHPDRREVMYSLIKLAVASKQLPRMLYVFNVDIGGSRDPWRPGGFADIYRATLNGKAVVLKRLRVQLTEDTLPDVDQRFRREALVWRQLKHPYILPLLGIDADTFRDTGSLPCLVSPLMSRGTLRDYVRSTDYVPVRDFYRLLQEAAEGLVYLHEHKVVHGDVKDVNILIDDGCHVQLCDFGLVVVGDTTEECFTATSHGQGTKSWMSPQRLTGSRYRRTTADDVYAYGCLCYYLSTGHAPFHALSDTAALLNIAIRAQRPRRPCGELVTDRFWALIELCWAQDAAHRPSMATALLEMARVAACHVSTDVASRPSPSMPFADVEPTSRLLDGIIFGPPVANDSNQLDDVTKTINNVEFDRLVLDLQAEDASNNGLLHQAASVTTASTVDTPRYTRVAEIPLGMQRRETSDRHEIMPSLSAVERLCVALLGDLLLAPLNAPAEPGLHALVHALRTTDPEMTQIPEPSDAEGVAALLHELRAHVLAQAAHMSARDARLAQTLVSLLAHFARVDTLARQVPSRHVERAASFDVEGRSPPGSPLVTVDSTLLWDRIEGELEDVLALCRMRGRDADADSQVAPPDYPPEYEECESGQEARIQEPLAHEDTGSDSDIASVHSSVDMTTGHEVTSAADERTQLNLDAMTSAIDRLFQVLPQLHEQRAEHRRPRTAPPTRVPEPSSSEGTVVDEDAARALDVASAAAKARELNVLLGMLGRAAERELTDQTVVLGAGGMAARVDHAGARHAAHRQNFTTALATYSGSGRLSTQDAVLRAPRAREGGAAKVPNTRLLKLPELVREAIVPRRGVGRRWSMSGLKLAIRLAPGMVSGLRGQDLEETDARQAAQLPSRAAK